MKIIYSLFFLTMICYNLSGQCGSKIDPFSKEKIDYYDFWSGKVYYELSGDSLSLSLGFWYGGQSDIVLPQGTELLISLENGEILSLKTIEKTEPVVTGIADQNYGRILTIYTMKFSLDIETLNIFAAEKLTYLRFQHPTIGNFDTDLNENSDKEFGKAITKGAKCILKQMTN